MAEILVFTKDIQSDDGDVYKTAKLYKRGYVVTVQEDGWNWGKEELSNPLFRILKMQDMAVTDLAGFLSWEPATQPNMHPAKTNNTLQRRAFKLNLDDPSLPQFIKDHIADDTRAQQTLLLGITPTALMSLKTQMAAIPDPQVIGIPSNII